MVNVTSNHTGKAAARGHAAMLLFSLLVAGSFAFGGIIAPMVDSAALNAIRFAIACGVIGTVTAATGGFRRKHFDAPWRFVLLGACLALYFILMFVGLKTAAPVSSSAVFTLTPLMAAGFGWLLMRQVTTPRMALALSLAGAGAVWVIFRGDPAALMRLDVGRGEAVFFVGCIAHALYTPLVRFLSRGEPTLAFTFGVLVAGCVILAIVGAPALLATDWTQMPMIVWLVILYLAIFTSSVTFFLLQYATLRLPSAKVMAYTYLVPVWVSLLQGIVGTGWPQPILIPGIAAVLLGLWLLLKE